MFGVLGLYNFDKAQKVQKYALNSQLQELQILTNDDEVENWSLSSFLLAVPIQFTNRLMRFKDKSILDSRVGFEFASLHSNPKRFLRTIDYSPL